MLTDPDKAVEPVRFGYVKQFCDETLNLGRLDIAFKKRNRLTLDQSDNHRHVLDFECGGKRRLELAVNTHKNYLAVLPTNALLEFLGERGCPSRVKLNDYRNALGESNNLPDV